MAKAATAEVQAPATVADQIVTQAPVARVAIEARGVALLALIKAAPQGFLMLTQAEGQDVVAAGQAAIAGAPMPDGTVPVTLTPMGEAVLAAAPAGARKPRASVIIGSVRNDIPPPPKAKRGNTGERGSKYPFDTMEVGQSLHFPATASNPQPLVAIQSSLTMARNKFAVPVLDDAGQQVMETVTHKEYQKDAQGKFVKDSLGKRVVVSTSQAQEPKMKITRDFTAAAVDASDPDGVGARVWRIA